MPASTAPSVAQQSPITNHQLPLLGILGSGQLGRMFALAARRLGYSVHVFSPEANSPAGQVADREIVADYTDLDAVRAFARGVGVVTFEFENVPAETALAAAEHAPVRPGSQVLHVCQDRLREKDFLANAGLPVTPYAPVSSPETLAEAVARVGLPAVLKTVDSGYDGKGQANIADEASALAAWDSIGRRPAILEARVPFERELSMVAARGLDGAIAHYGLIENHHVNHILDLSLAPAAVPPALIAEAAGLARCVLESLDVVGVLCVEFFLAPGGRLFINELAPRPHNSGHITIEAAPTSQFEQQLRAVCGLPLGATQPAQPAAMANLLGDLWASGEPNWAAALAIPNVHLHLYGKRQPRSGRKMGHLTALAPSPAQACELVLQARRAVQER